MEAGKVAKIFSHGDNQLVALPEGFNVKGDEVFVNRFGDALILVPKERTAEGLLKTLGLFTEDFMADGRKDLPLQERSVS